MPRRCVAMFCSQSSKHLYEWPRDEDRAAKWTAFVKAKRVNFSLAPTSVLCYKHFKNNCFVNRMAYDLKYAKILMISQTAVPTLQLSPEPSQASQALLGPSGAASKRERKRMVVEAFSSTTTTNKSDNEPSQISPISDEPHLVVPSADLKSLPLPVKSVNKDCITVKTKMNESNADKISIHSDDSNSNSGLSRRSSSRLISNTSPVILPDDDLLSKNEKEMRMLTFANPGKFLDDFDPERSTRELRKMQRKLKPKCPITKPSNTLYDETGCIRETGVDICDCLDIDCPGCHFPCSKCASEKCATECRCNRKWHFDNIYVEGTEIHIKMPMKINKVT